MINSSANKTSYTYNMLLAEDTARRVKRQFVARYGEPLYTIGNGASGEGLAQYLLAQMARTSLIQPCRCIVIRIWSPKPFMSWIVIY